MSNAFALCNTIEEIRNHWEILTSPENLSCDGELPVTAQEAKIRQYRKDITQRVKQISS